ncbi:alpha/beta-hydrolase [Saitoella complicata NRRL Y-17804]|nr:alpha/beta-hydrolase [Saitoella complicata NRRL Y-17804]ODQ53080.1 alpha/beta-hydrolase [Saitoella complicata NRRL Y-17804]
MPSKGDWKLKPIGFTDVLFFMGTMVPRLLVLRPIYELILLGLGLIAYLVLVLPIRLIASRLISSTPYSRRTHVAQDAALKVVGFLFAYAPVSVGRIFFSTSQSVPFMKRRFDFNRWVRRAEDSGIQGWWVRDRSSNAGLSESECVVMYLHGGGLVMGSAAFYLEFLANMREVFEEQGFANPAVLAVDYTLVPDGRYPTQLQEVVRAYTYLTQTLSVPAERIVLMGDSAGGLLITGLLLHISRPDSTIGMGELEKPGVAVMMSPWLNMKGESVTMHTNDGTDYLDPGTLDTYAREYTGPENEGQKHDEALTDPYLNPIACDSQQWLSQALPVYGLLMMIGSGEIFRADVEGMYKRFLFAADTQPESEGGGKCVVELDVEEGMVHAWPMALFYLGGGERERVYGTERIVGWVRGVMGKEEEGSEGVNGRRTL